MRAPRFGEGQVYTTTGNDEPYFYDEAICKYVDPELFFPDERLNWNGVENDKVKAAKKICGDCKHEVDCASYAIVRPYIQGIWGGTTGADRRRIRREYNIVGIPEPTYETGGSD